MPNRTGLRNTPADQNRPGSFNRQLNSNRTGIPNRPSGNFRQGGSVKKDDFNRPGSRFSGQKSPGIRKPVSPNELLQLQKTNKTEKDKPAIKNKEKQNIESPKQKAKAPNIRPSSTPSSKKPPHRTFSNSSKKPGKTDWDDSAKLEALRNKNPQKQ